MSSLEKLNRIPRYGIRLWQGDWYEIKFCMKDSPHLRDVIRRLKARHPELVVHLSRTGRILFGGRFHRLSNFWEERSSLTKSITT